MSKEYKKAIDDVLAIEGFKNTLIFQGIEYVSKPAIRKLLSKDEDGED